MVLETFLLGIGMIVFVGILGYFIYNYLNRKKTPEQKKKENEETKRTLKFLFWIVFIILLSFLFSDLLNKITYGIHDEGFIFILGLIIGYFIGKHKIKNK